MSKRFVLLFAALALAGCGKTPDDLAIEACKAAVSERLAGKAWSMADDELKAGYKAQAAGGVEADRDLPRAVRRQRSGGRAVGDRPGVPVVS
jgi:hypothetical protein